MICPKCGHDAGESKFCPECGCEMNSFVENNSESIPSPSVKIVEENSTIQKPISVGVQLDATGETYYDALKRIEDEKEKKQKKKKKNKRIGCLGFIILIVFILLISVAISNHKSKNESRDHQSVTEASSTTKTTTIDSEIAANQIDEKIKGLEETTISVWTGSLIKDLRKTYDSSPDEVKSKVKQLNTLVEAEKKYQKIMDSIGKETIKNFTKEYDKVEDTTWYYPKTMPKYIDSRSYVLPYIGKQDGKTWIVIRWNYTGKDWIFFKKVVIKADNNKFNGSFNYFEINHNNGNGKVWETMEQSNTDLDDLAALQAIANAKSAIVRFQGDDYSYDLTVSKADKAAINDALKLYLYFLDSNSES